MSEFKRRWSSRWRDGMQAFFTRPWESRSATEKVTNGALGLAYLTTRKVFTDRSTMMAAGLAFFTVLAMVPLLTVATTLVAALGVLDSEAQGIFDTVELLFPEAAYGVASYLEEVATTSTQALGGIGAVSLLIIGLVLFNAIEETLTQIWRGAHDRSIVMKMLTFNAVLTFGPVLIALSIVQSVRAQVYLDRLGVDISLLGRILPILYALVAFSLLFRLVPNAPVTWRAALVGALFAAIVFELAKWGFNLYVSQLLFQTYDRVYGTLALIPIGLIWIYIVWLVILVGAELAYCFQHFPSLMRAEGKRLSPMAEKVEPMQVHPIAAFAILAPLVEAFEGGKSPLAEAQIGAMTGMPKNQVAEVLDGLRVAGVIVEVGDGEQDQRRFVPASAPASFGLDELISRFWVQDEEHQPGTVQELSRGYLKVSKAYFEGQSMAELARGSSQDDEGQPEEGDSEENKGGPQVV